MTTLWFAPRGQIVIMNTLSSVNASASLESQFTFVSQETQDSAIKVGVTTLTLDDDVAKVAQSFTADGLYVDKVTAYVGYAGTPTDSIQCKIYSDNLNEPGTLLATSTTYAIASLTNSGATQDFEFKDSDFTQQLRPGSKYWIEFSRTGSTSDANYYTVYYEVSASTVANHALSRYDAAWAVDASGYDLYHVIYAGGVLAKDIKISGGERDVEALKLIGYNEIMDEKRATVIEYTFTAVYQGSAVQALQSGTPSNPVGAYFRIQGGEKASNDRTKKVVAMKLNDGTYTVVCALNDAYVSASDVSLAADGSAEQTFTAKGLASTYYEEDNYAD